MKLRSIIGGNIINIQEIVIGQLLEYLFGGFLQNDIVINYVYLD